MQKWHTICGLQNSEGVSYTSTGEELPQQEILQAWWHSRAPQKCVWVGDQMGHRADAFFSSAGCAGFCNEPQHPLTNNTSGEESFHSLIEKAQNKRKQRDQRVSAEGSGADYTGLRMEWDVHQWQHVRSASAGIISPYLGSWYRHNSFRFPRCFLVLLQDCTTRHGKLPVVQEQLWPGQGPSQPGLSVLL